MSTSVLNEGQGCPPLIPALSVVLVINYYSVKIRPLNNNLNYFLVFPYLGFSMFRLKELLIWYL